MDFCLKLGCNDVKYTYAYGDENIYFILHEKYIPIQEYESSTPKNENRYLYYKDVEVKGDIITFENECIVEYGKNFIKCKFNHS